MQRISLVIALAELDLRVTIEVDQPTVIVTLEVADSLAILLLQLGLDLVALEIAVDVVACDIARRRRVQGFLEQLQHEIGGLRSALAPFGFNQLDGLFDAFAAGVLDLQQVTQQADALVELRVVGVDPDIYMEAEPGFFVNESDTGNRWIKIRLRGRQTNRLGVGARITVRAVGPRGEPIVRTYLMDHKTGFGSAPYLAHVGLLDAVAIDHVEVFWPGSGRRCSYPAKLDTLNRLDEEECPSG